MSARRSADGSLPSSPRSSSRGRRRRGHRSTLYPYSPPMCGIVGYVGGRPCRDLLIAGLEKLEYRGYDSAGISLLDDGHISSVRSVGNLANLRAAVGMDGDGDGAVAVAAPPATIGLAHTRWATHGAVSEQNAHPHTDCTSRIHI